jgi:hypothetical protein
MRFIRDKRTLTSPSNKSLTAPRDKTKDVTEDGPVLLFNTPPPPVWPPNLLTHTYDLNLNCVDCQRRNLQGLIWCLQSQWSPKGFSLCRLTSKRPRPKTILSLRWCFKLVCIQKRNLQQLWNQHQPRRHCLRLWPRILAHQELLGYHLGWIWLHQT